MDTIIYIISYIITIGIVVLPFFLMFKLAKALFKAIKKNVRRSETKIYNSPSEWKSEWSWDEKRLLWVHKSEIERLKTTFRKEPTYEEWKAQRLKEQENTEQNTYHYSGKDIIDVKVEIPPNILQNSKSKPQNEPPKTATNTIHTANSYKIPKDNIRDHVGTKHSEYQDAYEATPVLTQNEMRNYRPLLEAAMRRGYTVNVKTRLADIVKPRNNSQYMSHFGKIKSKHVDFVVFDRYMKIVAVVELDDSSHDRKDRKERDEFVDTILKDCGIKVIHTRHITPDILDNI